MIYFWQTKEWQRLMYAKRNQRLPHALWLLGLQGLGKALFAENLIKVLLCENQKENSYCDKCHVCRLIAGRSHPDVLWITPESNTIKIEQVREIKDFLNLSGLKGSYRIVLIYSADKMNINSANALLKTLEEPSDNSLIVLMSESENLPLTIKSRCQRIHFPVPPKEQTLAWLAKQLSANVSNDIEILLNLAHGAPLHALSLAKEKAALSERKKLLETFCLLSKNTVVRECAGSGSEIEPIAQAKNFQDLEIKTFINTAVSFIIDCLRLQFGVDVTCLMNNDFSEELTAIAQHKSTKSFIKLMDELQKIRAFLCNNINLNKLLLIENIFIHFAECA